MHRFKREAIDLNKRFFHLYLISDSTGETLIAVSRAAAAQYASMSAIEHIYPLVRSFPQMDRII
ncbi:MAG: kinase/pyrophosphorylase, partial [Dolichospermum sp.]